MNHYKFTEDSNGIGTLQKEVQQPGQQPEWVDDMKSPIPFFEIATKKYVRDKVAEADPDFKGTYNSMAAIEAISPVNANDWAYLESLDENNNQVYSRYRYNRDQGWLFEVAIKRDNFTDEEWAAITSGITSEKVQKLDDVHLPIEVYDITALTTTQLDGLRNGDTVIKVTGSEKHTYYAAYKKDSQQELSLVYCDHENIEEVYYEKRNNVWTYVQTDNTPLDAQRFAEISELVGDQVLTSIERDNEGNVIGVYRTLEQEEEENNAE